MRNSHSPKISSGTYRTVEVPTTGFLSSHRTNFWLAIHPPKPPALAHGMHSCAMAAGVAQTLDGGPLSAGSSRAREERMRRAVKPTAPRLLTRIATEVYCRRENRV